MPANGHKKEDIYGIDLGTTYSDIGVLRGNNINSFCNEDGFQLPSVVAYGASGKDVYVGYTAVRNLNGTFQEKMKLSMKNRGPVGVETWEVEDWGPVPPIEFSAYILKELAQVVKESDSRNSPQVKKVVISIPAESSMAFRVATKIAAEAAGLEVVALIEEPAAAALAYASHVADTSGEALSDGSYLVLDIGGGTTDAVVMELVSGQWNAVCAGSVSKGGKDFDAVIKAMVRDKFNSMLAEAYDKGDTIYASAKLDDVIEGTISEWLLRKDVEDTKRGFCHASYSPAFSRKISVSLAEKNPKYHDLELDEDVDLRITKADFDEQTSAIVNDIVDCAYDVYSAWVRNTQEKKKLEAIIMVGGTSNVPAIKEELRKRFAKTDIHIQINKELTAKAVVHGATLYAAHLAGKKKTLSNGQEFPNLNLKVDSPKSYGVPTMTRDSKVKINYLVEKGSISTPIKLFTDKNENWLSDDDERWYGFHIGKGKKDVKLGVVESDYRFCGNANRAEGDNNQTLESVPVSEDSNSESVIFVHDSDKSTTSKVIGETSRHDGFSDRGRDGKVALIFGDDGILYQVTKLAEKGKKLEDAKEKRKPIHIADLDYALIAKSKERIKKVKVH